MVGSGLVSRTGRWPCFSMALFDSSPTRTAASPAASSRRSTRIIHVNSPGGGAAASEEIYREVLRIRDQNKKPVVASIETVGASGAYYVSSATNKIFADNASIVGSIGVIAEWYNYEELLKWAKLQQITLKAGEFKDTGSPTRQMTPAERAYMQGLIDNMHTQFIHSVAIGRKMKDDQVLPLANGKVWTGERGAAAQADRPDRRLPRRHRGHGEVGRHQR